MSTFGAMRNEQNSEDKLLDTINIYYQKLLVAQMVDLNFILDSIIGTLSRNNKISDPIVVKAREIMLWKCQSWRDACAMLKKDIAIEEEYCALWGERHNAKAKTTIDQMKSQFYRKFKYEVNSAFAACPSNNSFEISSSHFSVESDLPNISALQPKPIVFNLKEVFNGSNENSAWNQDNLWKSSQEIGRSRKWLSST